MSLLYHAYVYLEFLILACTIYILAPNSVDRMMNAFKDRIDMEPISRELKDDLKNYEIISIQKRTLIVFTITAESGQLYDGKKYIREGSDLKEISE